MCQVSENVQRDATCVNHTCIVFPILSHAHDCMAPWYVAVGVLTVIGQPSKEVALVTNKSEAVSNPGAGKRAGPRRPRF